MDPELERLQRELGTAHQYFIQIAQRLAADVRNQPGVCGEWSPKEVIAHLIGWDQSVWQLIHDPANFDPPYDVHAHNARSVAARQHLSWAEAMAELTTSFGALEQAVATVQPQMPIYQRIVHWLPGRKADYELHAGQLVAWLT